MVLVHVMLVVDIRIQAVGVTLPRHGALYLHSHASVHSALGYCLKEAHLPPPFSFLP